MNQFWGSYQISLKHHCERVELIRFLCDLDPIVRLRKYQYYKCMNNGEHLSSTNKTFFQFSCARNCMYI